MSDEQNPNILAQRNTMRVTPEPETGPGADYQPGRIPSGQTITEYLAGLGIPRGVTLDAGVNPEVVSDLCVEGGRRYEVGRILAQGGMGVVRLARDLNCRRIVAIKMLPPDAPAGGDDLLRFIEEAQITSQLEHPNIVPVHELGRATAGDVFYTMKYVRGLTLTEILVGLRKGDERIIDQFPLGRLLTIYLKACDAVAFAHSRGVVHRDLKPDNIMIGDFGEVLVVDWGLATVAGAPPRDEVAPLRPAVPPPAGAQPAASDAAGEVASPTMHPGDSKTVGDTHQSSSLRTGTGRIMGTPGFMAPEQMQAVDGAADFRADIYSLGAILYSILTLRPPLRGKDVKELLRKILAGEIVPPKQFTPTAAPQRMADGPAVGAPAEGPPVFPHCPGGAIPPALSDIAMRALATDPAERYADVPELQREIEAFRDGLIWHEVVNEDFSGSEFAARWELIGAEYEVRDGELRMHSGEPQILLFKGDLPGDVRIEFECRQESVYLNTIGCFIGAIRSENRKEIPSSGYEFKYGGFDNTLNVLTRADRRIWSEPASPLARGQRYRVMAERVGKKLRLLVNNKEIFNHTDHDPLSGPDRTAVGLIGWVADTRISRVRIQTLGAPWKSDILDIAERQLQKGNYVIARGLFQDVIESFPDTERLQRARKGLEIAAQRDALAQSLSVWKDRIRQAWPGAGVQLRMDNDGLTVELTHCGITDLEPLRGMPITNLYCSHNRIRSLEPLRGMPLTMINCSGNPIESLEPLRGMQLVTCLCECCQVRSLEPLRGMPLNLLNCGGNPLTDGLEPLTGMRLTFLVCWGCGIKSLEPLRRMPLTALYAAVNQLEDLEPLRESTLNVLHIAGNRVASLEPLRGLKLSTLHAGENQIASLEPLRGMGLRLFSCQFNQIASLEPLKGMPLGTLTCGGNRLKGIDFFIKRPPDDFLFDCDTISTGELEWIHTTWARDFRFARHARNVEVLLALRRNDVARLRALAAEFRGHRYLFVPKPLQWEEARAFCEKLGGHLVTIGSREENEFVQSLFPHGGWVWMGLYTGPDGHHWVTGEPFTFSYYNDLLRENKLGPKVFTGKWASDDVPFAHNTFVIEWDE